jgi:hypothetical protein
MIKLPRLCVFCSMAEVTREHVWPSWIAAGVRKRFGEQARWTIEGSDRNRAKGNLDAIVKRVCKPCNGGWMSNIEGHAIPLLLPFILGDVRAASLSVEQQSTMAVWASKTLLMADFLYAQQQYPRAAYSAFFANKQPPARSVMWVAAFGGTHIELTSNIHTVKFTASNYPNQFGIKTTSDVVGVVGTLTLARLVIQQLLYVSGPDDVPLPRRTTLDGRVTEPVWPARSEPISWPPGGQALDADALARFVIRNGPLDVYS